MSNASLELGGDNWAAKDGNLLGYAVGDSSGKYVPREFTFTRGSNLAATRVAANGLIEKGRENLVLQSNQFDTTWTLTGATSITGGQVGYDGTNDAWILETSSAAGSKRVQQSVSVSGVKSYSVYAKAGTADFLVIGGSINARYFDLANGSVGLLIGSNSPASIEAVGNGWYRCTMVEVGTTSIMQLYVANANSSTSTAVGDNIYIQDAQLEQGLVATDYIETGATTVQAGLLEDEPRIDYTGGTGSLLLEPSRTNEFSFSEYASGNTLTGSPIITENYAISPDGGNNAFRIQDTTGGTFKRITESFSVSANSTYTQSIFVKKATSAVSIYGGVGFDYSGGTRQISYIIFDEYNGTMTAIQSQSTLTLHDAEDYGDYWRFSITATDTGSNNYLSLNIYACLSTNGTSPTAGVKDWIGYGLQLEQGSYPTSYIPNHSGGSVTRVNDSNKLLNQQATINATEGTLFLDTTLDYFEPNMFLGGIYGGGELYFTTFGSNQFRMVHYQGGTQASIVSNTFSAGRFKMLLTYKNNDWKFYINGVLQGVDTQGTFDGTSMSQFATSYTNPSIYSPNQKVHQFLYFDSVLSDAQCSALTVEGLKEEILTSYIAAVDTLEDGAEARLDTYLQNLEELIV